MRSSTLAGGVSRLQIHDENQGPLVGKQTLSASMQAVGGAAKRVALGEIGNTMRAATVAAVASKPTAGPAAAAAAGVSATAAAALQAATSMTTRSASMPTAAATGAPSTAAAAAASAAPAAAAADSSAPSSSVATALAAFSATALLPPLPAGVRNIDAGDLRIPMHRVQFVPEYINDVVAYLMQREAHDGVSSSYLQSQPDINENMRAILVDWLSQVHLSTRQQPETLHLAVRLLDAYLSVRPCLRQKLQLVGLTALLVASKVEEILPVHFETLLQLVDGAYDRREALTFERSFLGALKWSVTLPTAFQFIQRFLRAAQTDRRIQLLAHYLGELCLMDYKMLRYPPSHVAAGCVWAALRMCGITAWTATLEHYTTYSEAQARACGLDVLALRRAADTSSLTSTRSKYTSARLNEVSKIPVPPM